MRERSRHARKTPYSPRRERTRALEGRPRRAAIDVTVERWPRRHHLEQPHREVQPRADDDIRGRELFAEDPRSLRQCYVEHVEYPLGIAPARRHRIHLDLGRDLHHRRLDAAGCEKQPVKIFRAQRIARRRSEEHTSELQSLAYLVCRLLLEKKKK